MSLRTFTAGSAEEAYAQARKAFGPDACIFSTRSFRPGPWLLRWLRAPVYEVVAGAATLRPDPAPGSLLAGRPTPGARPALTPSRTFLPSSLGLAGGYGAQVPPGLGQGGNPPAAPGSGGSPSGAYPSPAPAAVRPDLDPRSPRGAPPSGPGPVGDRPPSMPGYPFPGPSPQAGPEYGFRSVAVGAVGAAGATGPGPVPPGSPGSGLGCGPHPAAFPGAATPPALGPVPAPGPGPDSAAQAPAGPELREVERSVAALKRQVDELAQLKGLLQTVLARTGQLEPAPVPAGALETLSRMPPPARLPEAFEGLCGGLKASGLETRIRAMVRDAVRTALSPAELADPEKVYRAAVDGLAELLRVGPPIDPRRGPEGPRIVVLVGPTGVGKTTTLAKLGAILGLEGKGRVAFVTLDTYRLAAPDQLKQYADIIEVPIKVAFRPEDLRSALRTFTNHDVVLVDTVGRSHRNEEDLAELSRFMGELPGAEVLLVVSATTKDEDLTAICRAFRPLGVAGAVVTKLDETSCYGGVVNLLVGERLPVHYMTTGQAVPNDIQAADARALAALAMPRPPAQERAGSSEREATSRAPSSEPAADEDPEPGEQAA